MENGFLRLLLVWSGHLKLYLTKEVLRRCLAMLYDNVVCVFAL